MSDDYAFDSSMGGAFAVVDNSVRYAEMNKGVQAVFFEIEEPDPAATEAAGTLKVRKVELVRRFMAGDMNSSPVDPVNDYFRERFAKEYAAFKAGKPSEVIDGTPLAAWPLASRGFVMELNALHIRSVEDLAGVADVNITRITDGRIWREKAKAWLASNKDSAAAARFAAEAERLRDDNADLKRQLADLAARVQAVETMGDGSGGGGARARHRAA